MGDRKTRKVEEGGSLEGDGNEWERRTCRRSAAC